MKEYLLIVVFLCYIDLAFSQVLYGPNNPGTTGNNASIGTVAWTNPGNVATSNNARSAMSTIATSQYQTATNFGFAIPSPANVNGIRVSVERRHNTNVVALLDNWTLGTTKTISTGTQRCLIVVFSMENGDHTRDLTAMNYGGQAMTQISELNVGNGDNAFCGRLEAWMLREAGIIAATNTNIVSTFTNAAGFSSVEYCEQFAAATYQFVDQTNTIGSTVSAGLNNGTTPLTLQNPLPVDGGGMALNVAMVGNNGEFTVNSGYTERIDNTYFNPSFATSGVALQISDKPITTTTTEQPTVTFSTGVNRHLMLGIFINRAPVRDNSIRVFKEGVLTGNNLANTGLRWPLNDATVNYGGPTELWGTTWTLAQVNAANFGAAVSATIQQGVAEIDHITTSVWATSTLPVELMSFRSIEETEMTHLVWATGSEQNNDYFEIQRSSDGMEFTAIGIEKGVGNSSVLNTYRFSDFSPISGTSYYRLKQVDFNGEFEYSEIISSIRTTGSQLFAFPNPTQTGEIWLTNLSDEIDYIDIFSQDLKFVKREKMAKNTDPIVHIEELPDASYYLFVHEPNGTKVVQVYKATR